MPRKRSLSTFPYPLTLNELRNAVWLAALLIFLAVATAHGQHTDDSLQTVRDNVDAGKGVLVDLREIGEWDAGHLQGALFLPLSKLARPKDAEPLEQVTAKLPKDKVLYLHCASGGRVLLAAPILTRAGYDVRPLKAGYKDLLEAGFIRDKRKPATPLPARMSFLLLAEQRKQIERVDVVLERMELRPGSVVADIGAGVGYYTLPLASSVGEHGLVFAVDIQQEMLDQLEKRRAEAKIGRIVPILGKEDDPLLPPGKVDWVLLVDAYHEFSQPEEMLQKIADCLAPDGKVALLEYRAENELGSLAWIPRDHRMTISEVMTEWTEAGFELVDRLDMLPTQHFFIFRKGPGLREAKEPAGTAPKSSS